MTGREALEWVNVREGSVNGQTAPRQAHLVDWSDGGYAGRCGFNFAPEDIAPRARYRQCRRCAELAPPGERDSLAIMTSSPIPGQRVWVIVRSNPHDWGLYRDGALYASLPTLAEAEQIISAYEEATQ